MKKRPGDDNHAPVVRVRRLPSRRIGWGTRLGFAVLTAAALGVFFRLPRWAEQSAGPLLGTPASPEPSEGETEGATLLEPVDASASTRSASPDDASEEPGRRVPKRRDGAKPAETGAPIAEPARVDRESSEAAFTAAVSEGLRELEAGNPEPARAAFERAIAMHPESREALEGLSRANDELRLRAIARHRNEALEHERKEEWRMAAESYGAVLAIDPSVRFAIDGKHRAEERAALGAALDFHIAHPERLSDEGVLAEATRALEAARELDASGQSQRERIARLDALVREFETPVAVSIRSDNLTEVTVYKVGRLGRFEHRELALRPGAYTVVGSRRGFRDVRRRLIVTAGAGGASLTIRCEDAI